MPDNITRAKGRSQQYKFDRGGMPTEMGPFIGIVTNNIDPTRAGRLQVWIEQFGATDAEGAPNFEDTTTWRTVSYVPPFYGTTNPLPGPAGSVGSFTGNKQSYGMWFTPPDLGTKVICFFVEGDPNQGYYIGCVLDPSVNHMLPAIGSSTEYQLAGEGADVYLSSASRLPVTEINIDDPAIANNPEFYNQTKPVHSYLAAIMWQQGLIDDPIRGPINSNGQRETPSAAYGITTPGQAIYQSGLSERDIKARLDSGQLRPQDIQVIARRGGHSLVMDDGDIEGQDALVRIRTAKGHQITMSDNGDCFYITHANGQTWIELGKQGTVDVFSTNSVNVRSQGTINLHADQDINMFAGNSINIRSPRITAEATKQFNITGTESLTFYSKNSIGIKSDGTLAMKSSQTGSWDGGSALNLKGGRVNINSGGSFGSIEKPAVLTDIKLPDTVFQNNVGWVSESGKLITIVTRAPTHEPYPYHNEGVNANTSLSAPAPTSLSPAAAQRVSSLQTVPVTSGISTANLVEQPPAGKEVGSLNTAQVTGMLAQTKLSVNQSPTTISADKGVGSYGISPQQLELTGYLKPGTVQTYLQDPNQVQSVLGSPAVWTGKSGVSNLDALLNNPGLQATAQNDLMIDGLSQLRSAGVVTGTEPPQDIAPLVQSTAKFGVENTLRWVQGRAPADIVTDINQTAKSAQYSVNFVDTKAPTGITGVSLGGFTGGTERTQVDQAVSSIIGNPKIPTPDFGSSIYSGVPNSQLTYSGDDETVRERINEERRRRGLPPISA